MRGMTIHSQGRLLGHLPSFAALLLAALVVSAAVPARAAVSYSYDLNGRLICVDNGAGAQRGFVYDPFGNLLQIVASCSGAQAAIQAAVPSQELLDQINAQEQGAAPQADAQTEAGDGSAVSDQ